MSVHPPSASLPRRFLWALFAVVAAATAARAWLHFHSPLTPGINGAYYFVQARAMLETGAPGIPDLPLTFWLHAALARMLELAAGLPRDTAIELAVKCADSFLPALAALPLGWLGWRWQSTRPQPPVLAAVAPAALACLGAQALGMTGDFQKNSLALVWLAMLGPAAHVFLTRPGWRSAFLPLLLFALLGLTHIGVLGAALVFTGALALAAFLTATPELRRRLAVFAGIGLAVFVLAGTVIYRSYDPARVKRLVNAFSDPSSFTQSQGPGGLNRSGRMQPPPDFPNAARADRPNPDGRLGGRRGFPGPGGPPGMGGLRWLPGALFLSVGGGALLAAWFLRRRLPAADRSVLLAAGLTAALLGGPWFDMDKAQRLMLIAIVPAAMALSFFLATIPWPRIRLGLGGLVLVGSVASAALYLPQGGRPTIAADTLAELRTLAPFARPAGRTLIVARHGLEWWTAWALHTHIAQPTAVTEDDWKKFDRVLYLVEKQGGGPGRAGRVPGLLPARRPQGPDARPAPPGDFGPDDRPPGGPGFPPMPPQGFAAMPGGPRGGPFANRLPDDARVLHDGLALKLAQADAPPAEPMAPEFPNAAPRF